MASSIYRVTSMPVVVEQIRRHAAHAKAVGLAGPFLDDLQEMYRRVGNDPVVWGDPLFDYRNLAMTRFRGQSAYFLCHYSVHEETKTTYVHSVVVNPLGPLG